jgi:hypothetical protein
MKYTKESKYQQYLKIHLQELSGKSKTVTLLYTSLYKVKVLKFNVNHTGANLWRVHQKEDSIDNLVENQFVWGAELISGLATDCIDEF